MRDGPAPYGSLGVAVEFQQEFKPSKVDFHKLSSSEQGDHKHCTHKPKLRAMLQQHRCMLKSIYLLLQSVL